MYREVDETKIQKPPITRGAMESFRGKNWNNKDKQVEVFSTMITLYLPLLKFLSYIIAVLIATKQ